MREPALPLVVPTGRRVWVYCWRSFRPTASFRVRDVTCGWASEFCGVIYAVVTEFWCPTDRWHHVPARCPRSIMSRSPPTTPAGSTVGGADGTWRKVTERGTRWGQRLLEKKGNSAKHSGGGASCRPKSNSSDRTCLKISFLTQREGDPRQRRRPERWFHWHHV